MSANNSTVMVSKGTPQRQRAGWEKWLPAAVFVGLSGFVLVAELLDVVQFISAKIVLAVAGGVVGFFAAWRSGLFRQGK